jgi:alkaline phosphatase D
MSAGRREFLLAGSVAAATLALPSEAQVPTALPATLGSGAPTPNADFVSDKILRRIAFGSCAKQSKPQPIWNAVLESKPDLFVFLGDNCYGDSRDVSKLQAAYDELGAQPGFRRLQESVPVIAIWDDHDYGEDDAGREYPIKSDSQRVFCDFWGEAAGSPRRQREGIYASYSFGPADRTVQLLMPDLRFNRSPILRRDLAGTDYERWAKQLEAAGKFVPGPYERMADRSASMLGETQWQWLEEQLRMPASVRILASSLQVLADFPGWEAWINYSRDHARLIDAIRRARANGLVCISGDTHYGELSLLDVNVPYPLWDLTSSGLTEVWHVTPPNDLRVGEVLREENFGVIEIDWRDNGALLSLQVRDARGRARIEQRIDARELVVT